MNGDLFILLEDKHCLAVAKPAGLLTQSASPEIPSLEAIAKAYLKEKHHKPGNVYLGVPHRLDRPVSGVVLFARNSKSAERLAEQFRERTVTKVYWGVVEGKLEPAEGNWEDWLLKAPDEARVAIADASVAGAKRAELRYRVLKYVDENYVADTSALTPGPSPSGRGENTLVEFVPITGRSHQIRVQAASRGVPLLGDALYGSTGSFGPPAELPRDRIIALHGRSLTFLHPLHYEPITLAAPLPAYWRDVGVTDE